ncbi:mitochondrial proton/calcium exchanger protein-like [Octopus sinensis]|nr:mitochondrial proton/calcium exchanger protein-like [Octopus sinensis]
MAKFLQNTLEESVTVIKKNDTTRTSSVEEFVQFMKTIRNNAEMPETSQILKFCKLFEDDLTMDGLNRDQLIAICRLLDMSTLINPTSTVPLLRFRLGIKLRMLKADDKVLPTDQFR